VTDQLHALAASSLGKEQPGPLDRRLSELQNGSGHGESYLIWTLNAPWEGREVSV